MTTTEILTGIKNWVTGKLTLKQDVIDDLASIRSGAQAGSTSVQPADIVSYFDDAVYDSGTHRINFYHGQTIKAYIDASPFIVDGMVDDVRIENGYLVIDFNTASGKQDISIPLTDIFNPNNYYNKTQTDGMLAQKQDVIQDLATIRSGANAGATAVQPDAMSGAIDEVVQGLENGDLVPAMAETLAPWADQKAIATPDTYTDAVRTTGGDIPIETSAGSKLESIKPIAGSKWTAKLLFNGSYNMLNAAKWGAANSQPYVGGVVSNFVYFLVPELTLGTFGTADENNGLLFTDSEGENVQPTSIYFKPLGATVPQSLTDGTSVSPTSVSYDGKTYKDYATSGAGWLIIPKSYYDNDVCAHIAWEDWYDKHVSLNEPTTNPEAVVGILMLEGLLALAHSDKYLRGVNEEVCDNIIFGDTSATVTHMVDEINVAANAWTNSATGESDSQGNALYRHSATVSGIKNGGAACVEGEDGGIPLTVNGTTVSYIDTNAAAPASTVFYEVASTSTTKAYTDSIFNGSNINQETGVLPINDCSIEAQVAMDGSANITVKYAKNIVDQVAINATVDVPQIKEQVEEHEERITELEDTAVRTGSYDASVAVGLADNFKGDTTIDAEFYKRKTGGTQSVGSGIAAIKEVRGKSLVWNQLLKEGYLVDMGLPSGTLWASRNIDITQEDGFAASPFQYECSFFSWGNVDGHNPISNSAFDYDWGDVNAQAPYYEGQVYGETDGNTLTGNIPVGEAFDAARANLGAPWRMPTSTEFGELFANIKYINADGTEVDTTKTDKRVTVNGVIGLYIESTINGARLFFSCSGYGNERSWGIRGSGGVYWSSSWGSARGSLSLFFTNGVVSPQSGNTRCNGFAVRPVLTHKLTPETDGKGHKFIQYGDNITDLTLMYGVGNEPASVSDFVKLYPLNRYTYNIGEVIPFAGQNLVTTGFNQWDEEWEIGNISPSTGIEGTSTTAIRSKNFNRCIPNAIYYCKCSNYVDIYACAIIFYDSNRQRVAGAWCCGNTIQAPVDAVYFKLSTNSSGTRYGATYNNDICINISNPDRNGTYEPYEKHTLPLDPSQWRDKNGDLVFPYGGMHGVGTAYDYAKVDADGYIRKAVRACGQIDMGSVVWRKETSSAFTAGYFFSSGVDNVLKSGTNVNDCIVPKYTFTVVISPTENTYGRYEKNLRIYDSSYTDAATFKSAMSGVMLTYVLENPVEVELATPVYAKYLVDKDGTEEITPANGTTPYTTMANLSILYAMDARGEIKNLPKNYLSKESAENMLNAMVSAGVIASYTMTYDAANARYQFTIVAPTQSNE